MVLHAETVIDSDITQSTTWTKAGSPYIIDKWGDCSITSTNTVTLTIEAGVEVLMRDSRRLYVGDNAALVIAGSESEPVSFDLYEGEAAYDTWDLNFSTDRSDFCVADYAIFRNGSYNEASAMVYNNNNVGSITFRHCEFRNARGSALEIQSGCAARIESCTFADNNGAGIRYYRSSANQNNNYVRESHFVNQDNLDSPAIKVIFHGGGMPAISNNTGSNGTLVLVESINVDVEFPSMTWNLPGTCDDGSGIPYVLNGMIYYASPEGETSRLTIEAGNTLLIHNGGFKFGDNVSFRAMGTANNPIVFTHTDLWEEVDPTWRSITFNSGALVNDSVVQYAVFEYGGAFTDQGVIVWDDKFADNLLTIEHCTFRYSQNDAIFVSQDWDGDGEFSPLHVTDCIFEQNINCDIFLQGGNSDGPSHVITDCRFEHSNRWTEAAIDSSHARLVFSGNNTATDDAYIRLRSPNGELTRDLRFTTPGILDNGSVIPYLLSDRWTLEVDEETNNSITVTIDPGCIFHFQTFPQTWQPHINFGRNVTVLAEGTESQPIVFAPTDRWDSGNARWTGLSLGEEAYGFGSIFQHVLIEGADTAIESFAPGDFIILDSEFRNNDSGIYLNTGSEASIENCTFATNETGVQVGFNGDSGAPVPAAISNCSFVANDTGIYFGYPTEGAKVVDCSFEGNVDYAIENRIEIHVDAHTCNFGHTSGPLDDSDSEDSNFKLGFMYYNPDGQGDPVSDDVRYGADSDGDGLEDFWERTYFEDLTVTDGSGDADSDGLNDASEFAHRTHPLNYDTDGDGFADGPEVNSELDPLVANTELFNSAVTTLLNDPDLRETHGLVCDETQIAANIASDPDKMTTYGLYTEAVLRNLYIPAPFIQVENGTLNFTLQLEQSESLTSPSWQAVGSPLHWEQQELDDVKFFRIFFNKNN